MKNLTNVNYDIIIIGAGPAGLTSAIYAARAGMKVAIVEKSAPGGKMIKTDIVENYPGFNQITGPDLSFKFYEQATNLGTNIEFGDVKKVTKTEDIFSITLTNGKVLTCFAVIVATGTKENELGIPGEQKLYGKGVSYCAVCDGAFYKNLPVAVVGGGYSAVQEAMYLTQFVSKLYVIVRKDYFRADNLKVEKLKNVSQVEFLMETVVEEIIGENKVQKIVIKNQQGKKTLDVAAIFPYVGATPLTNFLDGWEVTDEIGYVLTNNKLETKISGLYAAGDVRVVPLRQISIAAGDGALAGQMAVEFVQQIKN